MTPTEAYKTTVTAGDIYDALFLRQQRAREQMALELGRENYSEAYGWQCHLQGLESACVALTEVAQKKTAGQSELQPAALTARTHTRTGS